MTTEHAPRIPDSPPPGHGKWVASPLLAGVPDLVHGFTTRQAGDLAAPGAADALAAAAGLAAVRLLRQVHGIAVAAPDAPESLPQADAWAGLPPRGHGLVVRTADCLPVLLVHPRSGRLGVVHAGWRGAVAGIVGQALEAMAVAADEVLAGLGPCIRPCCYQVGAEVAGAPSPHLAPWPGAAGRYRFDLPGLVRAQLAARGVIAMDDVGLCTACRPDLFYSHRRDGTPKRLGAFLGWRAR